MCVADEASILKMKGAAWNEPLIPYFAGMKRLLLLSGARLTGDPVGIHNLVKMIRPDCITDFLKFSHRFCDPVTLKEGVQFNGPSFS